ncbi:hypothetical protein BGV54_26850 [Burkholderia ubonensis]|nr:hypothetical protein BGV54_26850 [Burkholderia ubonensis]
MPVIVLIQCEVKQTLLALDRHRPAKVLGQATPFVAQEMVNYPAIIFNLPTTLREKFDFVLNCYWIINSTKHVSNWPSQCLRLVCTLHEVGQRCPRYMITKFP